MKKLPVIVLIGRTNVGKSTLFNILTKTRNALVDNYSGLTRDRQYGYINIEKNQKLIVIDTAGLDIKLNKIKTQAYQQTFTAIEESHMILFVVNARDGLMHQEYEIYNKIRKYKKEIILIINKIDGTNKNSKIHEFYSLGIKKIQKISAIHNQGINNLIIKYVIPWISLNFKKTPEKLLNIEEKFINIAFIGKKNVGKSTLINALLKQERMITSKLPGTTLDSISTFFRYKNYNYVLTDTAGSCKKKKIVHDYEKFSIIKTLQTIEKSNVAMLIIDASKNISSHDLSLADFIIKSGRSIVIVINKSDLLNSSKKEDIKNTIKNRLQFIYFSRIHFISALYNKGIFQLFKSINEAYTASNIKINTSVLTKTMYMAIKKHQPPIIHKSRIKLKYAHLGSSNPPKIIIHGNQLKFLPLSYKRYLINFFYDALKIKGTPIQVQFKDHLNPYIKKN